ncbi:methylmalonyl Co-A mutase-associated GTPase MeaB [Chitinophagaceae bacterium LB-8]|uniref:Methylmalonyl Co-A mutase-associated GTPase MeaB n=1 Tax=Paraflavisolibacter caeni TaxID=2982496 RepID=A0A9X2Y0I3_9BACT|nr:methylmalonyl Co-A mutase-associated GTPase MeaB [Paraflavisolibacter caeni]MCU7552331.1 methylmalonyl Co-A mutase-associated GTPase MeaB [Paraflavisolibacter caeni]
MGFTFKKQRHTVDEYVQGILNKDRVMLSKAITLVESQLHSDNDLAGAVIERILPYSGKSLRIGITGVPGAGKSTFIEAFGKYLSSQNKRIAVLTIDPSSQKTGGSILGDKTRMEELANDPNAFVRPSASGATLGGVHSKTRETMLLCEASGYDIIIIETVGVGQSETSVKGIVDFFLLLMLAGAGDELQGIKRGIMEMADAIVVNKADGDNIKRSKLAQKELQHALHMFPPNESGWYPSVLTCSAINHTGIKEIWELICEFEGMMKVKGFFKSNRQEQNLQWMHDTINYHLRNDFYSNQEVKSSLSFLEQQVETEKIPAIVAAKKLLSMFFNKRQLGE